MKETKVFSGLRAVFALFFIGMLTLVLLLVTPTVGVLCFLALLCFLCLRYEIPQFALGIFLVSFVIRLLFMLLVKTPIESDFSMQYEAARQFAAGDFSFSGGTYFQRWGYQTGHVIYQGLLLNLVDSPDFLRAINCLVSAGTNVLVYLIAKRFFSQKASQCTALAYAFFLFHASFVTVLANNIPASFFLFLGLFFFVREAGRLPRVIMYGLAGCCTAVAGALRPDVPLVLIPVAVYFVFRFCSRFTLSHFLQTLWRCVAFFLVFVLFSTGLSELVKLSGVNSVGLTNQDPLWGVVVGTNVETLGAYDDKLGEKVVARMAEKQLSRADAEKEIIAENLSAPPLALANLAARKISMLWKNRSLEWAFSTMRQEMSSLYQWLEELDGAMFFSLLLLSGIGFFFLLLHRERDARAFLFPFILFTTFVVYLVLEVQPRYAYVMQIAVFILAAGGFEALFSVVQRLRSTSESAAPVQAEETETTDLPERRYSGISLVDDPPERRPATTGIPLVDDVPERPRRPVDTVSLEAAGRGEEKTEIESSKPSALRAGTRLQASGLLSGVSKWFGGGKEKR